MFYKYLSLVGVFLINGSTVLATIPAENPKTPWFKFWSKPQQNVSAQEKPVSESDASHMIWHHDKERRDELLKKLRIIMYDQGFTREWQPSIEVLISKLHAYSRAKSVRVSIGHSKEAAIIKMPALVGAWDEAAWNAAMFREAVRLGDIEGIDWLIKRGVDPKQFVTEDVPNPLHLIGLKNRKASPAETIQKLIAVGVDKKRIDEWDANGNTLLHKAAQWAQESCLASRYVMLNQFKLIQEQVARRDEKNNPSRKKDEKKSDEEWKKDHDAFLQSQELKGIDALKLTKVLFENGSRNIKDKNGKLAENLLHNCPVCQGKGNGTGDKKESPCKAMLELINKHKEALEAQQK